MSRWPLTLEERFNSHIVRRGPDECWTWTGFLDPCGYGRFRVDGKMYGAHRWALGLVSGGVREDLHALHSCDNPSCVNPAHLRWGTHQENVQERNAKKRQARGERNGRAKLTAEQARQIRDMPGSCRKLGKLFGIADTIVGEIKRGERWNHV